MRYTLISSKGNVYTIPIDENDIVGITYGRVVVVSYAGYNFDIMKSNGKKQKVHWYNCKCKCGKEWKVRRNDLMRGHVMTCGKCQYSNKYGSLGNLNKRRNKNECKECNQNESITKQEEHNL